MSRRSCSVARLAAETSLEVDEALIALWDAGIDYAVDGTSLVAARDVARARRALGLVDERSQQSVDYWLEVTGLSRPDFAAALAKEGVSLSPSARRLPKGALRKVRRMFGIAEQRAQQELVQHHPGSPVTARPWETIGNTPIDSYLSAEEIEAIHRHLEEEFAESGDPIYPPGVKSWDLLSSAAERPRTALGDALKYETAEMAGAAMFHSIVLNHAFFNGNKRTGLVALIAFLDRHKLLLTCSKDALFRFTVRTAAHGLLGGSGYSDPDQEVMAIAEWIRANSRVIERMERPMKWIKLRKRLRELGCESAPASGVGNRLNISRAVTRRGMFGRVRHVTLRTQVAWAGDGTEAKQSTIHKIRRDLELDDAHNVDSRMFYEGVEVDSFIMEYRDILRRLARI